MLSGVEPPGKRLVCRFCAQSVPALLLIAAGLISQNKVFTFELPLPRDRETFLSVQHTNFPDFVDFVLSPGLSLWLWDRLPAAIQSECSLVHNYQGWAEKASTLISLFHWPKWIRPLHCQLSHSFRITETVVFPLIYSSAFHGFSYLWSTTQTWGEHANSTRTAAPARRPFFFLIDVITKWSWTKQHYSRTCSTVQWHIWREKLLWHNFYYIIIVLLLVIVVNLLQCLIYTLNFIKGMYVYEKNSIHRVWYYLWFQTFSESLGRNVSPADKRGTVVLWKAWSNSLAGKKLGEATVMATKARSESFNF